MQRDLQWVQGVMAEQLAGVDLRVSRWVCTEEAVGVKRSQKLQRSP